VPQDHKLTLFYINLSSLEAMNDNSMENCAIWVEHSLPGKHSHINKNLEETSKQKQTDPARFGNTIGTMKKLSMTPTLLYVSFLPLNHQNTHNVLNREGSCWSRHRTAVAVGSFSLFTLLAMVTSILVVCLTSQEVTGKYFLYYYVSPLCITRIRWCRRSATEYLREHLGLFMIE
jgi:hypothetical protein